MPSPPTPLRILVKTASRKAGGDRQLAAQALDPATGTTLSHAYLNFLGHGKVPAFPTPGRIGALAAALQVPYETVWLAAIIEFSPPRNDELLQRLIAFLAEQEGAPDLTEQQAPPSAEEMLDEAMRAIAAARQRMAHDRRADAA